MNDLSGPPSDPGTEKRILLAFALTFLVIAIMQPLFSRYGKQQQPQQPAAQQQPAPTAPVETGHAPSASAPTPAQPTANRQSPNAATKQAASETESVIENDLYRITFTNRGAQVKSWVLKKYKDDKGNPLELVHGAAAEFGRPLSLWTWDAKLRDQLNSALYVPSPASTGAERVLSYEFSDGTITARKIFTFDHTYVVRVETLVTNQGDIISALPAWPAGFGDQTVIPSYMAAQVVWQYQDKVTRVDAKKVSGGATQGGPLSWAGVVDQYFAAVFLPDEPENAAVVTLSHPVKVPKDANKPDPNQTVNAVVLGAAAGSLKGATSGRMFVGPKALDVLDDVHAMPVVSGRAVGPDLEKTVNFGTYFGWLARPLFLWLKWQHDLLTKWTHSPPQLHWGWAIVILTVVINVALLPLRVTSMKSALKMQRAQPQIKAIQEKYKKYKMNDPKRADMNRELQELYKRESINPAGGCLPLLLQMPFLIAFYSMLGVAIELRHAPWAWISDLSSPDPVRVLPILIIVTMFFVQKMTPQAGMDPVQQKMMTFMMPVMIGAISWSLAAGLCLYWTIGNILAIAQQYWINNTGFGKEMRIEMEKRAAKKLKKA
jgi:YidC/Oxa1 family membrane protein insertase